MQYVARFGEMVGTSVWGKWSRAEIMISARLKEKDYSTQPSSMTRQYQVIILKTCSAYDTVFVDIVKSKSPFEGEIDIVRCAIAFLTMMTAYTKSFLSRDSVRCGRWYIRSYRIMRHSWSNSSVNLRKNSEWCSCCLGSKTMLDTAYLVSSGLVRSPFSPTLPSLLKIEIQVALRLYL